MASNILIIGSKKHSDELQDILRAAGYEDLHAVEGVKGAAEAARSRQPEAILLDIDLPDGDSISLIRDILVERPVPIIVHATYNQMERVKEANEMGVSAHLFRPVTKESLIGALELGMSRFRQCQALHAEVGECREALRVRKVVERAKGILMKRHSLSEEEAFLSIQKLSRNNNMTMEKVAESIITASEVL